MIGRASYRKSAQDGPLPNDLKLIGEHQDMLRAVTLIVVEGERLPGWVRGAIPWEFESQHAMIQYRKGTHL